MFGVVGVVTGTTGTTGAGWPATGAAGEIGAAAGGLAEPRDTGCDMGTTGVAALPVLVVVKEPLPAALDGPELLDCAGCPPQPNNADNTANGTTVLTAHAPAKGLAERCQRGARSNRRL